jgi:hypothetical protein
MGYIGRYGSLGAERTYARDTVVADHRAGATVQSFVAKAGETLTQAQARAAQDPAAAAAEAAKFRPGYKPPKPPAADPGAPDAGNGGGVPGTVMGFPTTYVFYGAAGLLAFLLLRRKKAKKA